MMLVSLIVNAPSERRNQGIATKRESLLGTAEAAFCKDTRRKMQGCRAKNDRRFHELQVLSNGSARERLQLDLDAEFGGSVAITVQDALAAAAKGHLEPGVGGFADFAEGDHCGLFGRVAEYAATDCREGN